MDASWRRALAKALSAVENRAPGWRELLSGGIAARHPVLVVGVTGPPGSGKSTLIDAMAAAWAAREHLVGVLAVDPASPFSGGAVLGDRVRMQRCEGLDRVFIRSMSARGHSGGLNEAALDLCAVFSSFGISRILLETVGVGQNEVEVAFVADCTMVVCAPGLGDSVQAAKAGLMEVGDIYVVNKGDLTGAAIVARDLTNMLSLVFPGDPGVTSTEGSSTAMVDGPARRQLEERYGHPSQAGGSWHPPVLTTVASDENTVEPVVAAVELCSRWLQDSGRGHARRMHNSALQLRRILQQRLLERHFGKDHGKVSARYARWIEAVAAGRIDPHSAADGMIAEGEPDEL
jgi:LAO/AO transport system kinase